MNIHKKNSVYYHSQNFNILQEGKILLQFIDKQKRSKTEIAEKLGMSRRNLYQLFESKILAEETKQKFEDFFKAKIFGDNAHIHVNTHEVQQDPANDALIQMLILEIAKIKSKMYGISVDDAIDELEKNARIALRQVQKD